MTSILKSNPDEIWKYYRNINDSLGQMNDAVRKLRQASVHTEERLQKKKRILAEKTEELEKKKISLYGMLNLAQSEEEITKILAQIREVEKTLDRLCELERRVYQTLKAIRNSLEQVILSQQAYSKSFSEAKRILNQYLKVVEIEKIQTEMSVCTTGGKETSDHFFKVQYRGSTFYCNNESFDPHALDEKGRTNIQRMQLGYAPIGYDREPVELHHMLQSENLGSVMEIPGSMHREEHKVLHINTSAIPTGINRSNFNVLRAAYWRKRAAMFE